MMNIHGIVFGIFEWMPNTNMWELLTLTQCVYHVIDMCACAISFLQLQKSLPKHI